MVDKNSPKEDLRSRAHWEGLAPVGATEFMRRLVTTIKPRVIVENRSSSGFTIPLAQGLNDNGFGKLVVYEPDSEKAAPLKNEIAKARFSQSVSLDIRQESLLESRLDSTIDLLLCSNGHEQVMRRLLPQINPVGLILLYATEGEIPQVRQIAVRLEAEGTLSVVTLPEKLGLVMAQKRAGRK